MSKISSIIFLLLYPIISYSQNLIVNADFEDVNICKEYQEECSPKGWRPSSLKQFGYTKDKANNRYVRLLLFDLGRKNERKFAQTELLYPLEKDQRYKIKFKVKPKQFWIKEIGIAFSDTLILTKEVDLNGFPKDHLSIAIPEKVLEQEWYTVEQEFTATKAQRFLIVGNFLDDVNTISKPINKRKYKKHLKQYLPKKRIEYGIDDIELLALDPNLVYEEDPNRQANIYADSSRHSLHRIKLPKKKETIMPAPEPSVVIVSEEEEKENPSKVPGKIIIHNLGFAYDQSELLSLEYPKLDQVVEVMKKQLALKVKITGHTDAVGSEDYNLTLSRKRAIAVRKYLSSKGIRQDRMKIEGKGERFPLSDNESEAGKQKNRRVEIEFY